MTDTTTAADTSREIDDCPLSNHSAENCPGDWQPITDDEDSDQTSLWGTIKQALRDRLTTFQ